LLIGAYEANNFSILLPLHDTNQERLILETYMVRLTGDTASRADASLEVVEAIRHARQINPDWEDIMLWVEDLKETVKYQERSKHNPFVKCEKPLWDFTSMAAFAEQIIRRLGRLLNTKCSSVKGELLEIDTASQREGYVSLDMFHEHHFKPVGLPYANGREYLRSLGALDEQDHRGPSVSVSNYMYASAMCLAPPGVVKLCCPNECNLLIASLEQSVSQPLAPPMLIAELVEALPSSTIAAPRNLSRNLRHHLEGIAEQHGGKVPLHSQAFAQWMHHAFPAECPNPDMLGSVEAPWMGTAFILSESPDTAIRRARRELRGNFIAVPSDGQIGHGALEEASEVDGRAGRSADGDREASGLLCGCRLPQLVALGGSAISFGIGTFSTLKALSGLIFGARKSKADRVLYS